MLRAILVAAAYVLSGRLGLTIPYVTQHITLIWPPTGIAVAALIRWGLVQGLGVFAGALAVNLMIGSSVSLAVGIAVGNTAGPMLATWLLQRLHVSHRLDRRRDLLLFVLIAAIGGMLVTSTNGVLQLALNGVIEGARLLHDGLIWWLGDAMGVLVVGIPLAAFSREQLRQLWRGWHGLEIVGLIAATLVTSALVFCTGASQVYPATLLFLPVLMMLWLALRGGVWVATSCGALVSLIAIVGTVRHTGVFRTDDTTLGLMLVWSYIASLSLITALVTTLTSEMTIAEARWRKAIEGSKLGVWDLDVRSGALEFNAEWESMLGYGGHELPRYRSTWLDRVHPEDLQRVLQVVQRHRQGETSFYEAEFRMRRKDGGWSWVFSQGKVIERDKTGDALRIIGTHTNISRQKEAEAAVSELSDFYRRILDNVVSAVWVSDRHDKVIYTNAAVSRMIGLPAEQLVGRDVGDFPPQMVEQFMPFYHRVTREHQTIRFDAVPMQMPCGRKALMSGWLLPLLRNGVYDGVICTSDDVTKRLGAENRLQLAALVFEASRESIIITDAEGIILSVNRAFSLITQYDPTEVIGRNPRLLQSGKHDKAFYEQLWKDVLDQGFWQGELWNRRKDGSLYLSSMTLSAVRDHRGQIVNFVAVSGDISRQRAAEDQIRFMAYFDSLTGLPNRALLKDRAEQLFAHAHREHADVAVLFLDLDHFKNINDSLGHAIGDQLLQALARRLEATLRAEDTVGRLGGDEFLVVARCGDTGGVARLADKLLEVAAEPIEVDGRSLTVTPSIGISLYPRDGTTFADLLKNADIALYKAKDAGRAMYHFFTPEMNDQAVERLNLEHDIRRALNHDEFILHYQPQMRLSDGAITGVEALLRWNHPERGLLMPGRFIPVAEHSGLIARIGVWVLREACRQAQAWRGAGVPAMRVSVNISVRQLAFYDLHTIIESILAETGLPPQLLELEITETLLAQNVDETLNVLKQIRAMGVELAVDDFGTGYSSLSYLKRFPISKLKIDQSFVRDLLSDPDDRAIARAIVTMGHSLGMKVTAEGVESEEHLEILRLIGCDDIQGYLFGHPLPADALMKALPTLDKLAQHASTSATVGF